MKKLTREDAIRAYKVIINGRASDKERDHFILFFNTLISDHWSYSGLRYIKEQAWRRKEE